MTIKAIKRTIEEDTDASDSVTEIKFNKNKLNNKTMTRKNAVELYTILRELKNGSMSKEVISAFILMRLKLKVIFDEFETIRGEISEQTKPENFKEGDDVTEWNRSFQFTLNEWLDEGIETIETNILSNDDFVELITKNDMAGWMQDNLFETLVIK